MQRLRYAAPMVKPPSAHDAALAALIPDQERASYDRRVKALIARNTLLSTLEEAREAQKISKKELADRAGLDASSVRRMLTAETANPTTENAFLLLSAMDIKLQAVLPSGGRVDIV